MFNVTRPQPGPASLQKKLRYDGEDVLQALADMFFNKCYLCEVKDPQSLNIEHFLPHLNQDALKFSWDNLFFCCARCNNIKLARYTNLLNCSDPNIDVLSRIRLAAPRSPGGNVEVEAMVSDPQTIETADLLRDIYNSTERPINKQLTSLFLRKRIFRKMQSFLAHANQYLDDDTPLPQKVTALSTMQTMMGKHQEYSAFLRWLVLDDEILAPLLVTSID